MLWKGQFNWYGEIHILYRHASSKGQARQLMTRALAEELDVSSYQVRQYFNGSKDNCKITEERR